MEIRNFVAFRFVRCYFRVPRFLKTRPIPQSRRRCTTGTATADWGYQGLNRLHKIAEEEERKEQTMLALLPHKNKERNIFGCFLTGPENKKICILGIWLRRSNYAECEMDGRRDGGREEMAVKSFLGLDLASARTRGGGGEVP